MSDGEARKDNSALREDIEAIRNDVGKLTGDMRELTKDRVRTAKTEARDAAGRIRDRGAVVTGELSRRIEEQPLLSTAVAFGIGMLIGKLIARR